MMFRGSGLPKNFVAQLYSQIVTFAVQLGSVPLLIASWGVDSYGVWLLLTAIPTYLAFSDFGFTFIAKNDMAMRVSSGDRKGALVTFQSILALLLLVLAAATIVLVLALAVLPFQDWLNLGHETAITATVVLGAQFLSVLLYQLCLLFYAGVRCEGRAATETFLAASWRLADAGSIVVVAMLGGGLALAASVALGIRLINIVVLARWLRKTTPWLTMSVSGADRVRIRELAAPSFSYMLVPISNALLIQGPVVILGAVASPAVVALFSVTRTVSRLGMSAANMVNYAFTPEYSFAFGRKDMPRLRKYLRMHGAIAVLGGLAYLAVMIFFGGWGISLLSHGQVMPIALLTIVMSISVLAEMFWSALFSPLSAINAHRGGAFVMAICSAVAVVVSAVFFTTPIELATAVAAAHLALLFAVSLIFYRARGRFLTDEAQVSDRRSL